jgi:Zn-finger nucleic acid-binding protein
VLCPKDRKTPLTDGCLSESLPIQHCSCCEGAWIPADSYETWQQEQLSSELDPGKLAEFAAEDYKPSPYDTQAALCPACGSYLARAKINLNNPFFIERCPSCNGIWCDGGEWEMLEKLEFHHAIPTLFTQEWQARVRRQEVMEQECQAMLAKFGEEIAQQIFDLAEVLEKHPNGDFGVAYLMRRFEE